MSKVFLMVSKENHSWLEHIYDSHDRLLIDCDDDTIDTTWNEIIELLKGNNGS